ncbi:MAG: L-threonylcarbamoyladenylate synthase [Gammaproteobacteria bacterium]|nr:L-threonylcarbamoyladenylate synthase [Gammaproteobacteria bacterium]
MASDFSIRHAAHVIKNGGIIAYPTDTIYGLGCDPFNADSVARLNTIKQRAPGKQFILLCGDLDQLRPLILLNEAQKNTISRNNEPISWVVDARASAPSWLCSDDHTLTIRISRQRDVQRLCQILGHAIISTSANLSGKKPAKNALELHKYFHFSIDKILASNKNLNAKPSKIIRLCDNHVIRE